MSAMSTPTSADQTSDGGYLNLLPLEALKHSFPMVVETTLERYLHSWQLHSTDSMLSVIIEDRAPESDFGESGFNAFRDGRVYAVGFLDFLREAISIATGKRLLLNHLKATGEGVTRTGKLVLTDDRFHECMEALTAQQQHILTRAEQMLKPFGIALTWTAEYQLVLIPLEHAPMDLRRQS